MLSTIIDDLTFDTYFLAFGVFKNKHYLYNHKYNVYGGPGWLSR